MGLSILNPRSTRRIATATGLDILRAWGNGTYTHTFVTTDHQHGWFDIKTKEWDWEEPPIFHPTSCRELFPGEDDVRKALTAYRGDDEQPLTRLDAGE